jgi:hypothetical protein
LKNRDVTVTKSDDQVLHLGKEEREKQNPMEIKAKVLHRILVFALKTPLRV